LKFIMANYTFKIQGAFKDVTLPVDSTYAEFISKIRENN
jgi:hypothetical protein